MRILFYRYNSICEADIINVFEENTFEVDSITEEMENKEVYIRPQIEVIELMLENVIAGSDTDRLNLTDDPHEGGGARSKRKFWDD